MASSIQASNNSFLFLATIFMIFFTSKTWSVSSSGSVLHQPQYTPNAVNEMARKGDEKAQYLLAQQYQNGTNGVIRNIEKAVDLLMSSAHQGFGPAQIDLAHLYMNGVYLDYNPEQAVHWFSKAADQDFMSAQYNLGNLYRSGIGVEKNDVTAREYYFKAAQNGFVKAQYNLALMYYFGLGGEKDASQVVHWFEMAASQGFHQAQYYLANMYKNGEGTAQNYKQAHYWYKAASEGGMQSAVKALKEIERLLKQQKPKLNNEKVVLQ